MKWTDEFLIVLAYSTKTQLSIFFGVVFFIGTLLLGHHLVSGLVFQGILAPLTDTIRPIIEHRYEKAAWGSLVAFLFLAFKCYKKDRKRFLSHL
jgi:hypothetical protein